MNVWENAVLKLVELLLKFGFDVLKDKLKLYIYSLIL